MVMSNELGELMACIEAAEPGDLIEAVRTWLRFASGQMDGTERDHWPVGVNSSRPPAEYRREIALLRVASQGYVTSGDLGELCNCTSETARIDLVKLALDGRLVKRGAGRGSFYCWPGADGDNGHDK